MKLTVGNSFASQAVVLFASVLPVMANFTPSQDRVYRELQRFLSMIPDHSPLIGSLDPNRDLLRMPRVSPDGRDLTWSKFTRIAAQSVFNPVGNVVNDCWFVQHTSGEEFRVVKMDPRGSANKWNYQNCTFVLKHPASTRFISHSARATHSETISHKCSASFPWHYACINPHHLRCEDSGTNEDRKGCRYGCVFLCPHKFLNEACIFTDRETGAYRPCVNNPLRFVDCDVEHDGSCLYAAVVTRDDLEDYEVESSSPQPSSQTTTAGLGREALLAELTDIEEEAESMGELGLGSRRS